MRATLCTGMRGVHVVLDELFACPHHLHPHLVGVTVFVQESFRLRRLKSRSPASRANSIKCATVISAITRSRQPFLLPAAFMFFILLPGK